RSSHVAAYFSCDIDSLFPSNCPSFHPSIHPSVPIYIRQESPSSAHPKPALSPVRWEAGVKDGDVCVCVQVCLRLSVCVCACMFNCAFVCMCACIEICCFLYLPLGDFDAFIRQPFVHTFTHRRQSQPRRATASSSGSS
uniref:Uncharacterized protein n=1 Tax=Gadus morhua TaxID=8049 RepID=A0A8C5AIF5_GADMO